ncbi:ras GEF, partial [Polychaeton citri CBS 116435]
QVSEPIQEYNLAVIGAEGVGKSTFIQRVFRLPDQTDIAVHRIDVDGTAYLVRLIELPLDEVGIDEDDGDVDFPEAIQGKAMPKFDAALMLYSIQDRSSFEEVPDMLTALHKSMIPYMLVSCKCDTPPPTREIEPIPIEQKAKREFGSSVLTLQTSYLDKSCFDRGILTMLRALASNHAENHARSASANRRRAQSSAVRPVSPRPPSYHSHTRASSEYTGTQYKEKDQKHMRHDSSLQGYGSNDRLNVPSEMHGSFLLEESASEKSLVGSSESSTPDLTQPPVSITAPALSSISENGATFGELVDRLLAQPKSKADEKFVRIFLALYRKFAAPGGLLEAIVERFDALEHNSAVSLTKITDQLRYTELLAEWIAKYPGDFAHPKTNRRMKTFVAKLSKRTIFCTAANEMSISLEAVKEDDDTLWAFSDRDREAQRPQLDRRGTMSSTASILIDDPRFEFPDGIGGNETLAATLGQDQGRIVSGSSVSSSQLMNNVEAAQRQAELLQPLPRQTLTKVQWRALYDQPDDLVARELTRIDWILFSSIRPRDLVRHVVLTVSERSTCKNLVNVNRMIEHFNQLACWVSNFILLRDKPKHRALMLEKFMRVARKVRELNNYNSLGAIIAGIRSTSIHRLAATRELIPPAVGKDWMRLEMLMGPQKSHSAYRLAWENSSGERIPYLPLHRRDIVTAFEGNKSFIEHPGEDRINWKKFEVMGEVIVLMQKAQGIPYRGLGGTRANEIVKDLVLDVKICKDEDELWERSLQIEPSSTSTGGSTQRLKDFFKR